MTTGTIDNSSLPNLVDTKSWSGGDGRFNPDLTPKWNPYHMIRIYKLLTPTTIIGSSTTADVGANLPSYDRNLEIKAINKTVDKAKGHSFNLAVATAESRQSIRLIKDNILSVGKSALLLKNGHVSAAVDNLFASSIVRKSLSASRRNSLLRVAKTSVRGAKPSDIGQKWLELQYGWLPLCSDTYELMKALHARNMRKKYFETSSASQNKRGKAEISNSPSNYSGILQYEETCSIKYRWTSMVPVSSDSLGLQDPLTVAWEVLPFSFVADWFLPIGPYLEAANQLPLLKGDLLVTKFIKGSMPSIVVKNLFYYEGCTSKYEYVILDRTVNPATSYRVPPPQFKTLEAALSPLHIANGIALLSTILSSDKRHDRFSPVGF